MPTFQRLDCSDREVDLEDGDYWLLNVEIDRLVTVECNLFAFAV